MATPGNAKHERILAEARERFDEADDFTVSVEEEFALLDPESLDLVNRFEEVHAAAQGTVLEPNLVGELIASEVEVKTGKQQSFADVPAAIAERRAQLAALVDPLGLSLGATGTHPWASWRDQRIIDTPHYRRNDEILRYVAWRNNSFGIHTHVAIRGADRAVRVTAALRNWLPELLAVSASSPFHEGVDTGLQSARTQIFTRFFPRCGVPDALHSWDEHAAYVRFLYETGSIDEHTQLWWSVRPHLAFPTVEIRICDAQPDVGEAQSLAALMVSLTARCARALDEGEPLPEHPHRLIEENTWRAIRNGLSGELIDLERGDVLPARARIERLIDWVLPVADEIGATPWLRLPERNAAEQQLARRAEGASFEEIYAEQVGATVPARGWRPAADAAG
jgi:glutamate---cysteine ligase / carboxylate-amine ligase